MPKRQHYTEEFKRHAVELLDKRDQPVTELARELGLRVNQIYKWREAIQKKGDQAFKGPGRPKNDELSEISRLKQELKRVKEENEILKKAAAYFAKDLP